MTVSYVGAGGLSANATSGAVQLYAWPTGYSPIAGDMAIVFQTGWVSDPSTEVDIDLVVSAATPLGFTKYNWYWRDVATNLNLVHSIHYRFLNGSEGFPQVTVPLKYTNAASPGGVLAGYVAIYRAVHNTATFDSGYKEVNSGTADTFQISAASTITNNMMAIASVCQGDDNTIIQGSFYSWIARAIGINYKTIVGGQVCMAHAEQYLPVAGTPTPCVWNGQASDSWVGIFFGLSSALVPSAPSNVTAVPTLAGGFTVSWSAVSSNGGQVLKNYVLQSSFDNVNWVTATTTAGTVTSVNVSGYGNNRVVYFRVYAVNAVGNSPFSLSSFGTTWNVPSQIGAPTVTPNAPGGFGVSWVAPQNGGTTITLYTVQVSTDNINWSTAGTTQALSLNVAGYGNGSLRYLRVYATNAAGNSAASAATASTTWGLPATVTNLIAVNAAPVFRLTWTIPVNGGTAITDYLVEWAVKGTGVWTAWAHAVLGAVNTCNVTGLQATVSYDFRIKAITAVGPSATYSNIATAEGIAKSYWGVALNA